MGRVELAQGADRPVAQARGVAEEEVELVPEHQRQHVGRPAHEQVVEPARRAAPVAAEPGADRRGVGLLALVAAGRHERLVGVAGRGQVGGVGAHQVQVGDQGVGHRCRARRRRPARWPGRRRRGGSARGGRSPGRSARWWRGRRHRVAVGVVGGVVVVIVDLLRSGSSWRREGPPHTVRPASLDRPDDVGLGPVRAPRAGPDGVRRGAVRAPGGPRRCGGSPRGPGTSRRVRARSALEPVVRARPPRPNASLSCSTSASSSRPAREPARRRPRARPRRRSRIPRAWPRHRRRRRGRELRRRDARRPLDRRARRVRADARARHLRAARGRPRARPALRAGLDRRGLRVDRGGLVHRGLAAEPVLALQRDEGRRRPARLGLRPHLRDSTRSICRGSNNYGPRQYPEKLIPLMVLNALHGDPLPVYGDGLNVRNWLFVEDFARGIGHVLAHGARRRGLQRRRPGRVREHRDRAADHRAAGADESLIEYVTDRPGHDRRYSLGSDKVRGAGLGAAGAPRRGARAHRRLVPRQRVVVGADPLGRLPRVLRAPVRARAALEPRPRRRSRCASRCPRARARRSRSAGRRSPVSMRTRAVAGSPSDAHRAHVELVAVGVLERGVTASRAAGRGRAQARRARGDGRSRQILFCSSSSAAAWRFSTVLATRRCWPWKRSEVSSEPSSAPQPAMASGGEQEGGERRARAIPGRSVSIACLGSRRMADRRPRPPPGPPRAAARRPARPPAPPPLRGRRGRLRPHGLRRGQRAGDQPRGRACRRRRSTSTSPTRRSASSRSSTRPPRSSSAHGRRPATAASTQATRSASPPACARSSTRSSADRDAAPDAARRDHRRRPTRGGAARRGARGVRRRHLPRQRARRAERSTRPTFASPDDAVAVVGATSSSSRATCAPAARPSRAALEPVITRIVLGTLERAPSPR